MQFSDLFGPTDNRTLSKIWQDKKECAINERDTILNDREIEPIRGFVSTAPNRKQRKTIKTFLSAWLPRYIFSGDQIKYSSRRGNFNYSKKSKNALNNRYLDIHDWYGNTKLIVLDCDSSIPEDFNWGAGEGKASLMPFMTVKNEINGHYHLFYGLEKKTKIHNPNYKAFGRHIASQLRALGLKVEDKVLLRARSPLFNPGKRKKAFEIREGRTYAEVDYHVTDILLFSQRLSLTPVSPSRIDYQPQRSTVSIHGEAGNRHDHMIEASHDERFTWLRKHGSITVDEAFDIFKRYASDLRDSDIMNDARCFAAWAEHKYTGDCMGTGDWYNGMYLNVNLNEMRAIGWSNYRENVGETKSDAAKRLNIPYWKIKDMVKQGLLVLVDSFYDVVHSIEDKVVEYVESIKAINEKVVISTNSGDDQTVFDPLDSLFETVIEATRVIEEPPIPPPKPEYSMRAVDLVKLWS